MKTFHDSSGAAVTIGREVGHGGEASVHEIHARTDWLAKVYHKPIDAEKAAKLRAMVAIPDAAVSQIAAWPTRTLHPHSNGPVVGLLMPRVDGHTEIHHLYSPTQQAVRFPGCTWRFLVHVAMNCAAAVDTVHQRGHVIGDVNQSGFMVSQQGTVKLIDCDSFQIRHNGSVFRCHVGVPEYTAPELMGHNFSAVDRTTQHDNFALAVLVFHILFMGRHPFAGRFLGPGDMPIEKAIHDGRFAFSSHAASLQMQPPPFSLSLTSLPANVALMFERAFRGPASGRPSASEWYRTLGQLRSNVTTCPTDSAHQFPSGQRSCPWCAIESSGGPVFFTAVTAIDQFDYGFDLATEWAKIVAIQPPCSERDLKWPPISKPQPTPIPAEAAYGHKGERRPSPPTPVLELVALPPLPTYHAGDRLLAPPPEFAPEPLPHYPEVTDFSPPELEAVPPLPLLEDLHDSAPPEPDYVPLPDELEPFVPETVPADPPLNLLPEPTPVIPEIAHALLQLEAQRRESLQDPNYRQSWMITCAAITAAVIGIFVHWLMVIAALCLALPTACVWLAMAWRIRTTYRRPYRKLIKDRRNAEDRYRSAKARIDEANNGLRQRWHDTVAELQARRTGLDARNRAAHEAWLHANQLNEEQRREVALRNGALRRDWYRACEAAQAARQRCWQERIREVETLQNEVKARNRVRMEEWRRATDIALQAKRNEIEAERRRISAANHEKRQRWEQLVEQREAERVADWERRLKKVQREREEVNQLNLDRRARWEQERMAHERTIEAVNAHNQSLQQSQEAFRLLLLQRETCLANATKAVDTVMAKWRSELGQLQRAWADAQKDAGSGKTDYEHLKQQFETEKARAVGDPRQNQLDDHLRNALLHKAKIPGIGRTRKATLRSYGIESAYDIQMPQIGNVPGFGPGFVSKLMAWRHSVVSQFVYQPGKQTNQAALRQLHAKYRTHKEQAKRRLLSARERLAEASRRCQTLAARTAREAHECEVAIAQALADVQSAREYARLNPMQ